MHKSGRNIRTVVTMVMVISSVLKVYSTALPNGFSSFQTIGPSLLESGMLTDADDLSRSGKWEAYASKIKDARAIVKKVRDAGNFISRLSGTEDLISLPVGIQVGSESGDFTATLVIEEIKIFQNYTQLFVILEIDAPVLGDQPLIFYSPDIKYSAQAGIMGDATIALMADFPVNVFDKKAMLVFKGGEPSLGRPIEELTHARIGCDGFESLTVAGEVLFSRDWLRPVADPHEPRPKTRVSGSFVLNDIFHPSEIYVDLDIDKFTVTGMEDFHWEVDRLSLDLSEAISPDYIVASGDALIYETMAGPKFHTLLETGNLWKGFYAGKIEITLPDKLTGGTPISFIAQDLIIDHQGISVYAGIISDDDLLAFGESSLNGWAFSIGSLEVIVTENVNWAVQFDGLIYIPVFSELGSQGENITRDDALYYVATIDPENGYLFTTGPASEKEMDLFLAQATILPSSSITLGYSVKEETIVTRAIINADIGISTTLGEKLDIRLPQLGIRELTLQNTGAPIELNTHAWEIINNDPVNLGIFEFGFDMGDPDMLTSAVRSDIPEPTAELEIQSYVQLSRSEKLTGKGGFAIEGRMVETEGLKKWVNEDFKVKEVFVAGRDVIPGLEYLEGSLLFYDNHPDYGSGFRGALTLEMKSIVKELRSIAQFGTYVDSDIPKEYYFIDAAATFDRGAPLGGAIYLRGIGGGFYKNMIRPATVEAFNEITFEPLTPTFFTSRIGESMSGIRYAIEKNTPSFGFRAMAILSSHPSTSTGEGMNGEMTLFNANLELGMQFKKTNNGDGESYGLQMIYFQGVGELMGDIDIARKVKKVLGEDVLEGVAGFDVEDLAVDLSTFRPAGDETPIPSAAISAKVLIQVKLDCPEVHGLLGMYVNAGILYGQAYADLLISKSCGQAADDPSVNWHLFFGTLQDPILLGIRIPIVGELLTVKSYFLAGNEGIPSALPPPLDYTELFDDALLNKKYGGYPGGPYPNTTPAMNGSGFATGMAMKIGTPPAGLKFLFMYASLQGGMGFDVMLNRYQLSECYDDIGINGWYGKGQAWLYANAEIGADMRLGFLSFRIKAFQAAAGAMLRVEGPNPIYGTGRLDAKLNLLGLLSTDIKFKVTLGSSIDDILPEECAPVSSPLDIPIIENVYPLLPPTGNAYPPGTSFIVELNYDIHQLISDPENNNKKYRVAVPMESVAVFDDNEPTDVRGEIEITDEPLPTKGAGNNMGSMDFPQWFSIKDGALRDIPYDYRPYPNRHGGTNYLVTPLDPLPSDDVVIIRPKAYILHARKVGKGYNYRIEKGYLEEPIYTFNTLPNIEDYKIYREEIINAYPIDGMQHFYMDEVTEADFDKFPFAPSYWVTLNKKKSFITENIPQGYTLVARIVDDGGIQVGENLEVERLEDGRRDIFAFSENSNLVPNTSYRLQMVYIPDGRIETAGENEILLYECSFKTSMYETLEEKLSAMEQKEYRYIDGDGDKYCEDDFMEFVFSAGETFGNIELVGLDRKFYDISPLVDFRYIEKSCEGVGWIADHMPSCQLYQFFDLCADDVLPEHLRKHPSGSLEISLQQEKTITWTSNLPATIFDINKYAFQLIRDSYCGETPGPDVANILDCNPSLVESFCDQDYDFPTDPGNGMYNIEVRYQVLFGIDKEITHYYPFTLKGVNE